MNQTIPQNTYPIIQGSRTDSAANPFLVYLIQNPQTFQPFNLTGVTNITACFQNADGSELMVSLGSGISILGNPLLGTIAIALTAAQTALLAVTDSATLELSITTSGDPFKVQIPNAYLVAESVC